MQIQTRTPEYLEDDFSMYLENMESLTDPENPDLLTHYLNELFQQLKQNSSAFQGLVDQLAMAINTRIKIDSKNLALINLFNEPTWAEVKPFVGVHADARTTITEIMEHSEQDLKTAVLLIHFYNTYDATPEEEDIDDEPEDDNFNTYDGDEYE